MVSRWFYSSAKIVNFFWNVEFWTVFEEDFVAEYSIVMKSNQRPETVWFFGAKFSPIYIHFEHAMKNLLLCVLYLKTWKNAV